MLSRRGEGGTAPIMAIRTTPIGARAGMRVATGEVGHRGGHATIRPTTPRRIITGPTTDRITTVATTLRGPIIIGHSP